MVASLYPGQLAPYSQEAEEALLGACMVDPVMFKRLRGEVSGSDFYILRHGYIWSAFERIADGGIDLDFVSVIDSLRGANQLDNVGGAGYLLHLVNATPTSQNAATYAELVRRGAVRRHLLAAADEIKALAMDEQLTTDKVTADAGQRLRMVIDGAIRQPQVTLSDLADTFLAGVEERMKHPEKTLGFLSGWKAFDDLTSGFVRGEYTTICGVTRMGKCLGKGTPVMMADGSLKLVEEVQTGDFLMGVDSKPRRVLSTTRGIDELFRVSPFKGDAYIVNSEHMLSLRMNGDASGARKGQIVNLSVRDYLAKSNKFKHRAKGWRVGLEFPEQGVELPPYFLGLWLGDGHRHKTAITNMEKEVIDYLNEFAQKSGLEIREESNGSLASAYHLTTRKRNRTLNPVSNALRAYGLREEKHIPKVYKINSRAVRLELLAGIIDTDGYLVSGCYEILTVSDRLADDYVWLARSLGFAAYKRSSQKTIKSQGFSANYSRIFVSGNISEIPVRVERKKASPRRSPVDVTNVGIKVEAIGRGEYYGFELDGDHLFLLGDFTVTHNSAFMLNVALTLAKQGVRVGIVTLEMSKQDVILRLATIESGLDGHLVREGKLTPGQYTLLRQAILKIRALPIVIDDTPGITPMRLESLATRWQYTVGLDILFVDYLQLMHGGGFRSTERVAEVTFITRSLKTLARTLNVPLVAGAQLNREIEKREDKRPKLSDLRESASIEHDSDNVHGLYREVVYTPNTEKPGALDVLTLKSRFGSEGVTTLYFEKRSNKITSAKVTTIDLTTLGAPVKRVYQMPTPKRARPPQAQAAAVPDETHDDEDES